LLDYKHRTAVFDNGVTYASSVLGGTSQTWLDQIHPDLPRMLTFNQDTLVSVADTSIAIGAKAVFPLAGPFVDAGTTLVNGVHDTMRVFGGWQNRITIGVLPLSMENGNKTYVVIWP